MMNCKITAYHDLALKFSLKADEPLKRYTSFRIGGPADLLALPKDRTELMALLKESSRLNIPVTLIGGGTNVLVSDKGIRGLVIVTRDLTGDIRVTPSAPHGMILEAMAGERLSRVCQAAMNHALSGLEFAAGIPGTLGGAIMMNAGAWGMEMADRVVSIEMVDPEGTALKTLDRKELAFSYRHLSARGILLAATLKLTNASAETIQKRVHQNLMQKKSAQPVSEASAGCFFKNPAQGKSAGELIELSGLKGLRINDAMVSCVHANYIVNVNAARCEDVLELKQHIQKTVFEKFHINLETEVRIEGEQ